MSRIVRRLGVALHGQPVGTLTLDERGGSAFGLLPSYRQMHPRPVLGQQFEDDDGRQPRCARSRLPSWFSNLLPEGALRQLMERHQGHQEFELLARVGEDLPGAARVWELTLDGSEAPAADVRAEPAPPDVAEGGVWHFSLAGEQLKFSATSSDRGLTIPVAGQGGDWILKLPHPRYPKVPENEFATMQWARASGLEVPDIRLVNLADVTGLPARAWPPSETVAFAIRRFDRLPHGGRVHMEDFAQVWGVYPEQKYQGCNYETLARLVWVIAGQEGLRAFIRRMVFMLACGNGDAHLKNWSLLYPQGAPACLSPAYDLVSTIQYHDDMLALNFGKSKRWADVRMATFRRLAQRLGVDEAQLVQWVQEAVSATLDAWATHARDFGFDADARGRLAQHMAQVPVLAGP